MVAVQAEQAEGGLDSTEFAIYWTLKAQGIQVRDQDDQPNPGRASRLAPQSPPGTSSANGPLPRADSAQPGEISGPMRKEARPAYGFKEAVDAIRRVARAVITINHSPQIHPNPTL